MGAIASVDQLINTLTGGEGAKEFLHVYLDARVGASAATAPSAAKEGSLWRYNKMPGGAGGTPSTSAIPVNDTPGAFFQTDPGGGRQKWLCSACLMSTVVGVATIYDRLVHQGGLSGTSTSAQTTNLPTTTLTRYSGAESVGNQIWIEIYSQIGSTATTLTASYTNESGTASRTTKAITFGGSTNRDSERLFRLPLQDGDTGVRSVESVTLAATTGTAGNFGVLIAHPLCSIPVNPAGSGTIVDFLVTMPSMPEIKTDACLAIAWMPNSTTAPTIIVDLEMVEA